MSELNKAKLSERANSVQHGVACLSFTSTPKAFRISKQIHIFGLTSIIENLLKPFSRFLSKQAHSQIYISRNSMNSLFFLQHKLCRRRSGILKREKETYRDTRNPLPTNTADFCPFLVFPSGAGFLQSSILFGRLNPGR